MGVFSDPDIFLNPSEIQTLKRGLSINIYRYFFRFLAIQSPFSRELAKMLIKAKVV
jgi:hypothetical protein